MLVIMAQQLVKTCKVQRLIAMYDCNKAVTWASRNQMVHEEIRWYGSIGYRDFSLEKPDLIPAVSRLLWM